MSEDRFEFGANWSRFLNTVDEARIAAAMDSLRQFLSVERLDGRRFLDVGSGSGLMSLAAHRLGATVHSFDNDPQSVACTRELRRRFGSETPPWIIESGSALDPDYLATLPAADIVYAWGVLHHTGDLWQGVDLVARKVPPGGLLFLAIYNDQGRTSDDWQCVKRLYQRLPRWVRPVLVIQVAAALALHRACSWGLSMAVHLVTGHNPLAPLRTAARRLRAPDPRGMHRWYDLVDWVGGWPFEVARPEEVLEFLRGRGFILERLKTCGGKMGCNEYLFRRNDAAGV
jgi:2-polyprenyl-6-hydroxyphenyl methylase/3-demethylubiquinone-9 3-methyltransferase